MTPEEIINDAATFADIPFASAEACIRANKDKEITWKDLDEAKARKLVAKLRAGFGKRSVRLSKQIAGSMVVLRYSLK
jgi:hypothetical protein